MATSINISTALGGNEQSQQPEARSGAAARGPVAVAQQGGGDRVDLSLVGRVMGSKNAAAPITATSAADAARLAHGLRDRLPALPALALAAQAGQTEQRLARLLTAAPAPSA